MHTKDIKVKFYLDAKTKRSLKPIFVYIRHDGKAITFKLGFSVEATAWDKDLQKAKKDYRFSYEAINNKILSIHKQVNDILTKEKLLNPKISNNDLMEILKKIFKNNPQSVTETEFFKVFVNEYLAQPKLKANTVQSLKTLLKQLKSFEETLPKKIKFEEFNYPLFHKFENFLYTKGVSTNTASKTIKQLKTFLYWSYRMKYSNNLEFKTYSIRETETDKIALTQSELDTLQSVDLSWNKKLDRARDLFLFMCYTGQRISDLLQLKKEHILKADNGITFWNLQSIKTDEYRRIPLCDNALKILEKYTDYYKPLPTISSQKLSQYIKELCDKLDINHPIPIRVYNGGVKETKVFPKYMLISNHTARRTFCTLALERGLRPEILMRITGHKDMKTLQKYIKITEKIVELEFLKIANEPLKLINAG